MGITPVIHRACLKTGGQFWKDLPDCRQRDRNREKLRAFHPGM
jgi:hypothetical protein